jgi:hypothetical protein
MRKLIEETFEKNGVYMGGFNNTLGFVIWRSGLRGNI